MTTLRVRIESLEDSMTAVTAAFRSAASGGAAAGDHVMAFPSWEVMHRVLAPKRLEIVRVMTGQEPMSIREIARRVGRDFKGVHGDVDMLLTGGVLDRAAGGGVVFPYDRIHVEFDIDAAA